MAVDRVTDDLAGRLGRAPTVDEIGAELEVDAESVLEAREALSSRGAVSLSAPGPGDADEPTLEDRLGCEDDGLADVEERTTIDSLLETLSPRERMMLRLRFEEDLTQREIGAILGVSQMQVSRALRETLGRLRRVAREEPR